MWRFKQGRTCSMAAVSTPLIRTKVQPKTLKRIKKQAPLNFEWCFEAVFWEFWQAILKPQPGLDGWWVWISHDLSLPGFHGPIVSCSARLISCQEPTRQCDTTCKYQKNKEHQGTITFQISQQWFLFDVFPSRYWNVENWPFVAGKKLLQRCRRWASCLW